MGWIYDVGYEPAYRHEGWPASVLDDGTDTSQSSTAIAPRVVGWHAACECGWRGLTFYARSQWPSQSGMAPEDVDGWESDSACYAEWTAHVEAAVPELRLVEIVRQFEEVKRRLDQAVQHARTNGASWTTIGRVTGMTDQTAWERWSTGTTAGR